MAERALGTPVVHHYQGEFVDGVRRGVGSGTLVLGTYQVTFTGRWADGPREGLLAGDITGGIEFDEVGRVKRIDGELEAPALRALDPAASASVPMLLLHSTRLAIVPGCLGGDCTDGDGVLALSPYIVLRATFASGHEPVVHERVSISSYERGAFPIGWLHGEGRRVWRGREPMVEAGWFVAGEFVGDRAAFDRALGTSAGYAVQTLIERGRAASAAATRAHADLVAFVDGRLQGATAVPVVLRAELLALVRAGRATALAASKAWDVDPGREGRGLKRVLAQRRVRGRRDRAYDATIATGRVAEHASVDGRELATALRRTLDVIATRAAEHATTTAALHAQLQELWGQAQKAAFLRRIQRMRAEAEAATAVAAAATP